MTRILEFGYTNHKGIYAKRRVLPAHIYHGTSKYYMERQWLLHAYDLDKKDYRDFALVKMVQGIKP